MSLLSCIQKLNLQTSQPDTHHAVCIPRTFWLEITRIHRAVCFANTLWSSGAHAAYCTDDDVGEDCNGRRG